MPAQLSPFIMLIAMFGLLYFMTIRPQKKRAEEMKKVRESLKLGDQIVTIGGIRGRITALRDDSFEIETGSDHMRMELLRDALSYVVKPTSGYQEQPTEAAEAEGEEVVTEESAGESAFTTDGYTGVTDED
ncbi:MAG: preprotein translocase subunit YajC [Peptoniphilaceae bacterium]|nr:preprotein translocase subunit YajC [Peptoniphilaceae bacterium]MDY6086002.1 preprotein translocase subunit YajC [Peptoniphilaceae bacterium]